MTANEFDEVPGQRIAIMTVVKGRGRLPKAKRRRPIGLLARAPALGVASVPTASTRLPRQPVGRRLRGTFGGHAVRARDGVLRPTPTPRRSAGRASLMCWRLMFAATALLEGAPRDARHPEALAAQPRRRERRVLGAPKF